MGKRLWVPGIVRVLAYAAISMVSLPLVAVCAAMSPRVHGDSLFYFAAAVTLLSGCIGALLSEGIHKALGKADLLVRNILLIVLGVLFTCGLFFAVGAVSSIDMENDPQLALAIPACGGAAFACCAASHGQRFFEIMSVGYLRTIMIAVFAGFMILRTNGMILPFIPQFSVLLVFVFLVYWSSKNQKNIEFMMERRQHSLQHLPKRIRMFNLSVLGIFFGVTVVSLLLKNPIMALLDIIGKFLQNMLANCMGVPPEALATPTPRPEPESSSPPGDAVEAGSSWIWQLVLILMVVVLAIIYGPVIVRGLVRYLRKATRKVVEILRRDRRAAHVAVETDEYNDTVETLSDDEKNDPVLQSTALRMKNWKKNVHQYRRMKNGEEKYRRGYALILEGMQLKNLPLLPGDTPLEATEKIRTRLATVPQMEYVTQKYMAIRYALDSSDTDSGSLDDVLRVLETMRPLPEDFRRLS